MLRQASGRHRRFDEQDHQGVSFETAGSSAVGQDVWDGEAGLQLVALMEATIVKPNGLAEVCASQTDSSGIRARCRWFSATSRTAILSALSAATSTPTDPIPAILRPREHAPLPVVITIQEASDGHLEWTIDRSREKES